MSAIKVMERTIRTSQKFKKNRNDYWDLFLKTGYWYVRPGNSPLSIIQHGLRDSNFLLNWFFLFTGFFGGLKFEQIEIHTCVCNQNCFYPDDLFQFCKKCKFILYEKLVHTFWNLPVCTQQLWSISRLWSMSRIDEAEPTRKFWKWNLYRPMGREDGPGPKGNTLCQPFPGNTGTYGRGRSGYY